jgi:hypothetical protein
MEKSLSQITSTNFLAAFANKYCFQMTEAGFAEYRYGTDSFSPLKG